MSLTVRQLNADTTFLLTFAPTIHAQPCLAGRKTFTILLDPWLDGPSQMWHPKFLSSSHKKPAAISSLRDIASPDLVVISQDKPDHCHAATLRQLDAESPTLLMAEATAARKIRRMRHFHKNRVRTIPLYSPSKSQSILKIPVPGLPEEAEGEVTIACISGRRDLAGVHKAIGITFRPPSRRETMGPESVGDISVIYTPHGVEGSLTEEYAKTWLAPRNGLPLTLLLHSFDRVSNPWWMGGNVCTGTPGGATIARQLQASCWISAHDEVKDTTGISVAKVQIRRFSPEQVAEMVGPETHVCALNAGDSLVLPRKRPT